MLSKQNVFLPIYIGCCSPPVINADHSDNRMRRLHERIDRRRAAVAAAAAANKQANKVCGLLELILARKLYVAVLYRVALS